jgi:hypothetical protein
MYPSQLLQLCQRLRSVIFVVVVATLEHVLQKMLCVGHVVRKDTVNEYVSLKSYHFVSDTTVSFLAAKPNCLLKSVVEIKVNRAKLNALIDTGSSLSFTNDSLVKKCHIQVLPYFGRIALANSSLFTEIVGQCKVEVEMEGYTYSSAVMLIMKNLCSDAIIGHDVLQCHS